MWRQPARRWVAHVDMDAFFASVEQLDDPRLKGLPVIVGNSPLSMERLRELADEARKLPRLPEFIRGVRGVVASASYEARAFGVRSAMPLARALVLCPDAVVVPGRFSRYGDVAKRLRQVWGEFSPVVEPMSLDEAYLDMTGCELAEGPVRSVGERLKARIREETELTASVGIASSKLMAKIASDLEKPDGLVVVPHGAEAQTLAPMPVRALPGIGPKTAQVLASLGISRVGELAEAREDVLAAHFGLEHAQSLRQRAQGIDNSPVEVPGDPKSISRETTLVEDEGDLAELKSMLMPLADHVAWQLRNEGFCARCVYIKLRLLQMRRVWRPEGSGFGRLITRQCTLPVPTDSRRVVYEAAARLLESAHGSTGLGKGTEIVRLIGVGTTNLVNSKELVIKLPPEDAVAPNGEQPPPPSSVESGEVPGHSGPEKDRRLNASLDQIRERFGFSAISLGTSVKRAPVEPTENQPR
jgi:DNA polymerase-4